MGGVCTKHRRDEKRVQNLVAKPQGMISLRNLDTEWLISKWTFHIHDVEWIHLPQDCV
jgi:hypothetical protein